MTAEVAYPVVGVLAPVEEQLFLQRQTRFSEEESIGFEVSPSLSDCESEPFGL